MTFQHIRSFMAIANCKSITAAAKTLFITPTSLLQQLNLMERELGFKLFHRSRKGVTLTLAGKRFYNGCEALKEQSSLLLEECRTLSQRDEKRVRISIVRPYYLLNMASAYSMEYPDSLLEFDRVDMLTCSSLKAHLNDGTFDMMQAPVNAIPEGSSYDIISFPEDLLCCICRKDHPFSAQESISLQDLNGMVLDTFSNFAEPLDTLRAEIDQHGYDIKLESSPFSDQSVVSCCANHGVYVIQRQVASSINYLSAIPIKPALPCHCGLIYRKDAKPAVQQFAQYVREHMDLIAAQYV